MVTEDKEKYIEDFIAAVTDWWEKHILIDKKIDELSSGYYRLKRCEVKKLLKDVQVMCDSSSVQRMYDSSLARDYANNILHCSSEMTLKIETHKNIEGD